ncbi:MAG: PEP-CTERM sorting domain-containing protein [Planctomycetota bacterium]
MISFAGIDWYVKSGNGRGPGPNDWSDTTDNVEVINGKLHLRMTKESDGTWHTAEVYSQQSFGNGEYRWKTNTNFENLDRNAVFGLFTYENDQREIDVEFSRFGDANRPLGSFTRQKTESGPEVQKRFNVDLNGGFSTHLFRWGTNQIDWASIHGHTDGPALPGYTISEFQYQGSDIPPNTALDRVHMNLWLFGGNPPINPNLSEIEIIISDFDYTPLGGNGPVPEPSSMALMSLATLALLRRRVSRG